MELMLWAMSPALAFIVGWHLCGFVERARKDREYVDGATIPSNTRLVSSEGETFYTTRPSVVAGGRVVLPLRKDPLA